MGQDAVTEPRRYAVIGSPVSHSLSPRIHALFAAQFALPVEYGMLEPAAGESFAQVVQDFFAGGACGANVTLPFKEDALTVADSVSNGAKMAGAVNTLKACADGTISACNTDGPGLLRDIKARIGLDLSGKRVLVIGAGGAAAGTLAPLLSSCPSFLCVANRNRDRASNLVRRFMLVANEQSVELADSGWDTMGEHGPFDLVLHTTSAGHNASLPPLPQGVFASTIVAYDLSYGPAAEGFLDSARKAGVNRVSDGLGMLVEQAALSFAYWEGKMPATDPVLETLLAERSL